MAGLLTNEGVVGVVHLASVFLKDHTADDLDSLMEANLCLGVRVLEAAVMAECRWFINTGTFWQHHHSRRYRPANLYAATKQAFEDLASYYWTTSPIQFVTLKLNDTYGPGDPRPKVFSLWKKTLRSGAPLKMSPGYQTVNFLYVDDVVSAYLSLIQWVGSVSPEKAKGVFFRASGAPTLSLRAIAKKFEEVCGGNLNIVWGALPYRKSEVMKPWRSGRAVPGWKAKVTLEEGIRRILEDESRGTDGSSVMPGSKQ